MKIKGRDLLTKAIAANWRGQGLSITSDEWPGVLYARGGWRVIVSRNCLQYRFQEWGHSHRRWGPALGRSMAEWAASFAESDPHFSACLLSLPDDARDAAVWLAGRQGIEVPAPYRARYWSGADYVGVLNSDENLRSVIDRTGRIYAIQFCSPSLRGSSEFWITQVKGPSWPDLVEAMAPKSYTRGCHSPDPSVRTLERDKIRARLCDLFSGLPDLAENGPWPVLNLSASASDCSAG